MINSICREHTNLQSEDIDIIVNTSKQLQLMANILKADVFIDCMIRDLGMAIVVAEAKPSNVKSLYQESVVGHYVYRHNEPAAIRTLEIGMPTRDFRAITQEDKVVKQDVEPILGTDGNVIACLIVEKDVSDIENDNARMKILSQTTEQLTETLMDSMVTNPSVQTYLNDGVVIFNENGMVSSINPAATSLYRKLGYLDELINEKFENLVLDGSGFLDVLNSNVPKSSEAEVGDMTLKVKYANMKTNNLDLAGIVMVIKDITDERTIEKELILKSVAIREIHHRVKNNLQTIASLLRLQSRRIDNEEVRKSFDESINRVISIATTHEILAQNGVDDVDIKTILNKISENLLNISQNGKKIDVCIVGDSLCVKSDIATSIALVVNELFQNSLEYAFAGKDNGKIEISIKKGIRYSNISVIDDGIGFNTENIRTGSLGMKIVKSIIKDKLKGRYTIESNGKGTRVMFDFKM
jgi:two-component sensor histidine kinase/PAS domain-containing protein